MLRIHNPLPSHCLLASYSLPFFNRHYLLQKLEYVCAASAKGTTAVIRAAAKTVPVNEPINEYGDTHTTAPMPLDITFIRSHHATSDPSPVHPHSIPAHSIPPLPIAVHPSPVYSIPPLPIAVHPSPVYSIPSQPIAVHPSPVCSIPAQSIPADPSPGKPSSAQPSPVHPIPVHPSPA